MQMGVDDPELYSLEGQVRAIQNELIRENKVLEALTAGSVAGSAALTAAIGATAAAEAVAVVVTPGPLPEAVPEAIRVEG